MKESSPPRQEEIDPSISLKQEEKDPSHPVNVNPLDLKREDARKWIAITLLGIVAFIVMAAFGYSVVYHDTGVKDLAQTLLSPIVPLTSAVMGFYFSEVKIGRAERQGR